MRIKIFTTGGSLDKGYSTKESAFLVQEPQVEEVLDQANVTFDYEVESILEKDSLDITDHDREHIRQKVSDQASDKIIITHGTDTMIQTAMCLLDITAKTIIIVGAMQPARMRFSDASYNIGFASSAVQILPPGVYVAMNGQLLDPRKTRKNVEQSRFEPIE